MSLCIWPRIAGATDERQNPASDADAWIEIELKGSIAESEAPVYFAIVPAHRTWREPWLEEILEAGRRSTSWRVPPGLYRVACSAPGYWWDHSEVVEVIGGSGETVACEPTELGTISGRILAAGSGEALAGARIGHIHGYLFDFPLMLSPLGQRFAGAGTVVESDRDGRYSLRGPIAGRVPLWVEAEGLSPRLLPWLSFHDPPPEISEILLQEGASLRLDMAPPPESMLGRYRVTLQLLDPVESVILGESNHDTADLLRALWQRPLSPEGRIEWRALPPARFRALATASPGSPLDDRPLDLGTVDLQAGERASLSADPAWPSSPAEAGEPQPFEALDLLLPHGTGSEGLNVDVWWRGERLDLPVAREPVSGGVLLRVASGCRKGATYVLRTAEQVSRPLMLAGSVCDRPQEVDLVASAGLIGSLRAPEGRELPAFGFLEVASCRGPRGAPEPPLERYPVSIDRAGGGEWSVVVPSGCLEAKLEVGEFAPLRWNDLSLKPGEAQDAGTLRLVPGASLLVRIVEEETDRALEGAGLHLIGEDELAPAVRNIFAGRHLRAEASGRTDASGWVRLHGLPPGLFHLHVEAPDRAPYFSEAIELRAGSERLLDDLRVPGPAGVEVHLVMDPATRGCVRELSVHLKPAGASHWMAGAEIHATVDETDAVRIEGAAPGEWNLSVVGALDSGRPSLLASERVFLLSGSLEQLFLRVGVELFRGDVTYAGDAVEAALEFRQTSGGRQRFRAFSKEDGEWETLLPAGTYDVLVRARSRPVEGVIASVELTDPEDYVSLEVPAGRIEGVVVDGSGAPVAGARVTAEGYRSRSGEEEPPGESSVGLVRARTDDAGEFRFEGLAAGSWLLSARSGGGAAPDRKSSRRPAQLGPDEVVTGLRLVLQEGEEFAGRILSAEGVPVPGASGFVTRASSFVRGAPETAGFTSGPDGTFKVELRSEPGDPVHLEAAVAGGAAAASRTALGASMEVRLPDAVGAVRVTRDSGSWREVPLARYFLVSGDGTFLRLSLIDRAGLLLVSPTVLEIAGLPPGHWRIVLVESPEIHQALALGVFPPGRELVGFTVLPGQLTEARGVDGESKNVDLSRR